MSEELARDEAAALPELSVARRPALREGRVAGKQVLITGGGSGLGEAIARALADEGASVVIADVNEERGSAVAGTLPGGRFVVLDVTKPERVAAVLKAVAAACGRVDVVVNNAGLAATPAPTHEMPLEEWHRITEVNLNGAFYVLRASLIQLMAQEPTKGGVVLNMLSTAAHTGLPGMAPYTAAKAALKALTKSTAAEYAPYGIRVVGLTPTTTNTEMVQNLVKNIPNMEPMIARHSPLHGVPEPEDLAKAALFLCSDDAKWVSGSTIKFDGALLASVMHDGLGGEKR